MSGDSTGPAIYSTPCACPPGICRSFVEPDSDCINRLSGEVVTKRCAACAPGSTWHHNGECLRCKGTPDAPPIPATVAPAAGL